MPVPVAELPANPIEDREAYYDTLFQGELPYDPSPDEAYVGIAGLCRITRKSSRSDDFKERIEAIPQIVNSMLVEHDLAAREEGGEAIFSFLNGADRDMVGSIVSDIFVQWESTYNKHKLEPLLSDDHSAGQGLVIETAAAVMEVNGQYGFKLQKNVSDSKYITKVIANWGPGFARQWFDGTILEQWADEQQLAPEERAEWSETFSPGLLKHLAVAYVSDPMQGVDKIKYNLEEVLTDDNIAEQLEIPVAEIPDLVYDSLRRKIAVFYPSDPLKVIAKAKLHLDETLSDGNIAEFLGMDQAMVRDIFIGGARKHFAFGYSRDPLKACQDWINGQLAIGADADAAKDRKLEELAK